MHTRSVIPNLLITAIVFAVSHNAVRAQTPEQLIAGYVNHEPAIFYQHRLARLAEAIKKQPEDIPLHLDAAETCDRLADHDKAIAYAQRAWKLLSRQKEEAAKIAPLQHRAYERLGTSHVRRWLAQGADRQKLQDLKLAHNYFEKAAEVHGDAPSTPYMLAWVDWLITPPSWKPKDKHSPFSLATRVPTFLKLDPAQVDLSKLDTGASLAELGHAEALTAIAAMIESGLLPEVDGFHVLSLLLHIEGRYNLAYDARLRAIERIDAGQFSQHPAAPRDKTLLDHLGTTLQPSAQTAHLAKAYPLIRQAADTWRTDRHTYVEHAVKAGLHPDTDSGFWVPFWFDREDRAGDYAAVIRHVRRDEKRKNSKATEAELRQAALARLIDMTRRPSRAPDVPPGDPAEPIDRIDAPALIRAAEETAKKSAAPNGN